MNKEINIDDVILKTDRMILRPWQEEDLDDLLAYASVDGVGQMAGLVPLRTHEEAAETLRFFIEGKFTFALEYQGTVIGSVRIKPYKEEKFLEFQDQQGRELGFVLAKEYWGRGLMPEAVRAVEDYLFEQVGLDFILCSHFKDNLQSARAQEKCGFVPYKEIPSQRDTGEETVSVVRMIKKDSDIF